MDKSILVFKNGIYDSEINEFRKRVLIKYNYDFCTEYSRYKKDLLKFLETVIPNESDRKYLLTYLGHILTNTETDLPYPIFWGDFCCSYFLERLIMRALCIDRCAYNLYNNEFKHTNCIGTLKLLYDGISTVRNMVLGEKYIPITIEDLDRSKFVIDDDLQEKIRIIKISINPDKEESEETYSACENDFLLLLLEHCEKHITTNKRRKIGEHL
uniref:Uncharacterized protein n=1 Tax=viral metagenome TaxID=1070528 RepID=A0A6C0EAY5_9ZZZZ